MTGSLIQLVSKGEQDKYLTENPEISYFYFSYRQHTDFSLETHRIDINSIEFNNKKLINIPRIADLVSNIYFVLNIEGQANNNKYWAWVNNLGINIFKKIELLIGGNVIDTHINLWMNLWYQLTSNMNLNESYNLLIGNNEDNTKLKKDITTRNTKVILPLMFFFNKLSSLSLPQIAIQYHEIDIMVELNEVNKLINNYRNFNINTEWIKKPFIKEAYLLVDYVYLNNTEREIIAKSNNEILIDQVQYYNSNITSSYSNNPYILEINPHHPCKSFYWIITMDKYTNASYFLEKNIINATKRLIIIIITHMYNNSYININGIPETLKNQYETDSNNLINVNTLITLDSNNKIKLLFFDNKYTFITDNNLELNTNYLYFNKLKDLFDINNIRFNKTITKDNINNIDYSYITIKKNYIPSHMYSLSIIELFTNSNTISNINNINYPFTNFSRISFNYECIAHENYDMKIYDYNNYSLYLDKNTNPMTFFKFKLNNLDRIDLLPSSFYNYIQSYDYYTNLPDSGVNSFSFALNPMNHQPSGTCNFSNINNIEFILNTHKEFSSFNKGTLHIFLLNYNMLRIYSGHAGIAFS